MLWRGLAPFRHGVTTVFVFYTLYHILIVSKISFFSSGLREDQFIKLPLGFFFF